eukprot:5130994-Prymnesium_polylepis.1
MPGAPSTTPMPGAPSTTSLPDALSMTSLPLEVSHPISARAQTVAEWQLQLVPGYMPQGAPVAIDLEWNLGADESFEPPQLRPSTLRSEGQRSQSASAWGGGQCGEGLSVERVSRTQGGANAHAHPCPYPHPGPHLNPCPYTHRGDGRPSGRPAAPLLDCVIASSSSASELVASLSRTDSACNAVAAAASPPGSGGGGGGGGGGGSCGGGGGGVRTSPLRDTSPEGREAHRDAADESAEATRGSQRRGSRAFVGAAAGDAGGDEARA